MAHGLEESAQREDVVCLAFLAAVWIGMAMLANPIGDFPLNDDWVHGLAVKSILEHGEFRLPSPAWANVFSQAYWGALFCLPFGFSFTALRMSSLVLGVVGIWATFGILRELGTSSRIALLGAGMVAGNPLYFALANTFMTDVPFFAVSAASLFFIVRWALRSNTRDAVIGLLLALILILTRQASVVIPLGFAIAYVVKRGLRFRTIAVGILPLAIALLLHFGFQAWLHQAGRTPSVAHPIIVDAVAGNSQHALRMLVRVFVSIAYVGMFSLPILVVASLRTWVRSDTSERRMLIAAFGAATACYLIAMSVFGKPVPYSYNSLYLFGIGPLTLMDTYVLRQNYPDIPAWLTAFWYAANIAAIVGTGLLASMLSYGVRSMRGQRVAAGNASAMIAIVCMGAAYLLLLTLFAENFYDRYILFLLLPAVVFIGSFTVGATSDGHSRAGSLPLILVLLFQAMFSVVATRDYLEWNRTRWVATSDLLAVGVPRTSIDGGYEFNGWFGYDPNYREEANKGPWWVVDDEYRIASGPLPGYSVVRAYPFARLLTGQVSEIQVLRRNQR